MGMAIIEEFYRKMRNGYVIGPFMKTCDPAFVEAAGYAGMDFVILDMEHGPASVESLQNHIRAAQVAGVLPVVRVGSCGDISRVLDIGAAGVQIPQISSAKEAEAVVREAKYFPEGERGVCRFVRAAKYSAMEKSEYFRKANHTLVIIQLEGQQALENLNEIMEVPGIDILFIGPYDLSQSLGLPGQTTHPAVVEQMQEIVERAKKKHILVGTFTDSEKTLKRWSDAGVQYLSYSVDTGIFYEACVRVRERAKQMNAC